MTVFDLACLQNGELSAAIINEFVEGMSFQLNGFTYNVHKVSKLNKVKDSIIVKRQRITIKSDLYKKNIIGYLVYFRNGNSQYYGNDLWDNFSRDIEGIVNVDLINIENPLHDKSFFYKLAERNLQKKFKYII